MKEVEVLQRINDVDAELIEEASTFTVKNRKTWKVFLPIAASFLLIVGAFSGILYYNSNKVKFDANGKIDIYSIKGAQVMGEVTESGTSIFELGEPCPKEEYVSIMKEQIETSQMAVVYGTAKNIKMIALDDHVHFSRTIWEHFEDGSSMKTEREYDYPVVWWIVTFDIDVIDDLGTLDGRETVHVVMASRYATEDADGDPYYKLHAPTNMKEMLEEIQENPTGLFMLRNLTTEQDERLDDTWISSGNIWEIKGKEYRAVEFADYYVNARYDCDGESYRYANSASFVISLDELRVQKEERGE